MATGKDKRGAKITADEALAKDSAQTVAPVTATSTKTTKFAATLNELEHALQAWDEAVTQQPAPATPPAAPLYETKIIKELCRQLRELSKE